MGKRRLEIVLAGRVDLPDRPLAIWAERRGSALTSRDRRALRLSAKAIGQAFQIASRR